MKNLKFKILFAVLFISLIAQCQIGQGPTEHTKGVKLGIQPIETITDTVNMPGANGIISKISVEDMINSNNIVTYLGNDVILGNYIHLTDYSYTVTVSKWVINSVVYNNVVVVSPLSLTGSHATLDRIDLVVINQVGSIYAIAGEPSANPFIPDFNRLTEAPFFFVYVKANTTKPTDPDTGDPVIVNNLIYDENLGEPNEWTASVLSGTADVDSSIDAYSGTKSVEFPFGTEVRQVSFLDDQITQVSTLSTLSFKIKFTNELNNNTKLFRLLFNNSVALVINDGDYSIDASNIADWQTVIIPNTDIDISNFNEIVFSTGSNSMGFRIDDVNLQSGTDSPISSGDHVTHTSQLINDGPDGENLYITEADLYNGNQIIIGSYLHVVDYNFSVQADRYIINNNLYENHIEDIITLSASNPTLDRIDAIVINDDETFSVVTGTPLAIPFPPDIDELTQVRIVFILVKANTTEPEGLSNILVYDEGVESPTEWNFGSIGTGIDEVSTDDFYSGAVSIKFMYLSSGSTSINFNPTIPVILGDLTSLNFKLKLITTVPVNRIMRVIIADNGTATQYLNIFPSDYGIDGTNTTTWQSIVIPSGDFTNGTSEWSLLVNINRISFSADEGNHFFIDDVNLQYGLPPIVEPDSHVTHTSQLINDGENGESKFIEQADLDEALLVIEDLLPRDGSLPMTGDIDLDNNDIVDVKDIGFQNGGNLTWNPDFYTSNLSTGLGPNLQLGQEQYIIFYNDTGAQIDNGTVMRPVAAVIVGSEIIPTFEKAQSDSHENAEGTLVITTMDIPDASVGITTRFGRVSDINTNAWNAGDDLYLDPNTAGAMTNVKPQLPDYPIKIGGVVKKDVSTGQIFFNVTTSITDTFNSFFNGTFRETFNFTVTSDGATITGSLLPSNGHPDMTMLFSDGLTTLDTSPAATITLTQGTFEVPQLNFVYIPVTTKVLTISLIGFPINTEHIKVAYILVQDPVAVQSDKALINQNFNDHIQSTITNQGHLAHITSKLRLQGADHISGTEGSSVVNNTPTPDSVSIVVTGGVVSQLHNQVFDPFDTAVSSHVHVVNHSTEPLKPITDLHTLVLDGEILTNTSFSIVVWGVVNSASEPSKIFINLPSNSYAFTSPDDAVNDALNYTNTSIPSAYKSVGFLISKITYTYKNDDWVVYDTKSLTGETPMPVGGGGGGVTTFLGLVDTPNTYTGSSLDLVRVNAGETDLEYVDGTTLFLIAGVNNIGNTYFLNNSSDAAITVEANSAIVTSGNNVGFTAINDRAIMQNAVGVTSLIFEANGDVAFKLSATPSVTGQVLKSADNFNNLEWANLSISDILDFGNYVTTNTSQLTGLTGNKTWTGLHEFDNKFVVNGNVEVEGGNTRGYGGDVAFDAFPEEGRVLGTDEYLIPLLAAPIIGGQGNLGLPKRAGVGMYIETNKYDFATDDQIPYGLFWVRREGKALVSLVAKTKTEGASLISSRLQIGHDSATNFADQSNNNTLDVNGNIRADNYTIDEQVGEAVAIGELVYLKTDGKWWLSNANAESTSSTELAVVTEVAVADDTIRLIKNGSVTGLSGLTIGKYYLEESNGDYTNNTSGFISGSILRYIGTAKSTTELYFNPDQTYFEVF